MQFKNIQSFIKGLFENEGKEARIADEFLVKLYNVDIDISGKLKVRWGYRQWQDLTDSIASSLGLPTSDGFGNRIQKIFQYTDVAGVSYIVVIVDGKVFIETVDNNTKQWSCLTPNFNFINRVKHIDTASYLDILFFNDVGDNVYFYDSQSFTGGGWIITGRKFIYFNEDKIYFRKYSDFSTDYHINDIIGVNQATKTFTVADDVRHNFDINEPIIVENSTGNDGTYTVSNINLNAEGNTEIIVNENIPDNTADGYIKSNYRIKITGDVVNVEGKPIYDSLGDDGIKYPYKDVLHLGYALRVGNEDIGVYYYVLDNGKNQRGDNKCQIIKFNDRFIAQDWVELEMDPNGEIVSFDYYKEVGAEYGYIYIMTQDGRIEKINEVSLNNTPIKSNDVTGLTAPTNSAGKKQYSVAVNKKGIFTYSATLPEKSDWWQPPIIDEFRLNCNNPSDEPFQSFDPAIFTIGYNILGTFYKIKCYGFRTRYPVKYLGKIETYSSCVSNNKLNIIGWYETGYKRVAHYGGPHLFGYPVLSQKFMYDKNNNILLEDWRWLFNDCFGHLNEGMDVDEDNHRIYWLKEKSAPSYYNYKVVYLVDEGGWFKFYLLKKDWFCPCAFDNLTNSKYVLLVGVDENGWLIFKNLNTPEGKVMWRYIIPCGKKDEVLNITPLISKDNIVYFGTDMINGDDGKDHGKYIKWNLDTFDLDIEATAQSAKKYLIQGDNRWFIQNKNNANEWKIGDNWKLANSTLPYTDYINLDGANLIAHTKKQILDLVGNVQIDKLQPLGTPNIPLITMSFDDTTDFIPGTKFKYQVAFQFYSGKTTMLSPESEEITIPDLGAGKNVKIIISNLDLLDANGIPLYNKEDVQAIQLYRKQKDPGTDFWTEPNLIATISNENIGVITAYEDKQQNYSYNPFSEINVLKYPVNDIFVHKSRLILVNRLDYENSSIIQYSDVDMARAVAEDNIRPIESGDGDYLVAGISGGDYAYLFKTSKIYAILGDVYNGQLIDISKSVGTKYKNMIVEYNNIIYFMNDDGIYRISGPNPPEDLMQERIRNYFDKQRDDSIDFDNLEEHGFAFVDVERKEIKFYVPQKRSYEKEVKNNLCIIYNIVYNYFKIYEYYDNIFDEAYIKNIISKEYEDLIATYDGNIFQLYKEKNDNNKEIKWIIRTKEFNIGSDTVDKLFKIIKLFGRFLVDIRITYWIDGERYEGSIYNRDTIRDRCEAILKIWSRGRAKRLMIEISGRQLNYPPTEIEEILIGFQPTRRLK